MNRARNAERVPRHARPTLATTLVAIALPAALAPTAAAQDVAFAAPLSTGQPSSEGSILVSDFDRDGNGDGVLDVASRPP